MSIPLDYVLYSVLLSSGDIVGIYTGFNPESTNTLTMVENNICYSNVKMCNLFKVNDSTLRIVYQSTGDDPFLDIQISLKSTMPRSSIKDFLNNFRACRPSGSSVICTENALFDVGKIF